MDISDKVDYVERQKQTRNHHCHWPGCSKQVKPALWGCFVHWYSLPSWLRTKIWRAYRPGQEVTMDPSPEYLLAAKEVQDWIRQHYPGEADQTQQTDEPGD